MLLDKRDSIEPDEFWKSREKDLKSPILGKVLGKAIKGDDLRPLWGIFYTTSKSLYFQTFRSHNWLLNLFSSEQRNRTEDSIIEIPIEAIEVFRVKPQRGLLKFLKKPAFIELAWRDAAGELKSMNFETNGDGEAFVKTLPL